MTASSGRQLPVGTRYVAAYKLDTNGYPNVTTTGSTGCYAGVTFDGPQAFSLNVPEPRKIVHAGGDRVIGVDFLPPLEPVTSEIQTSPENMPLDALLNNITVYTAGSMTMIAEATSQQGNEIQAGILGYQQSLDLDSGVQSWRFFIIPKCKIKPLPAGMGQDAQSNRYVVAPMPTTTHLWGTALATGTEGATSEQIERGMSLYKPALCAWKGNNSHLTFPFPTATPAQAAGRVTVWKNGVLQTTPGDYSTTTTVITFVSAPATDAVIVALYETSA